jgi:hypothetical protein
LSAVGRDTRGVCVVLRNWRAIPVPLLFGWALINGCTVKEVRLGDLADGGAVFGPSADAGPDTPPEPLMCIGTECPEPYATCLSPGKPAYTCGADLSRDPDNCGECGNECLQYAPIHMSSRCVSGKCELECVNVDGPFGIKTDWRNCNGNVDDGCEVDVKISAKHCGSCGNACPAGQSCIEGKCGCPPGQRECPFLFGRMRCVDPETDDANCGGCGKLCAPPASACAQLPDNTRYGCLGGTCGHLKCEPRTFDCNQDVGTKGCGSDGCEVGALADRDNCGGCGIKCKANEECVDETGHGLACAIPCAATGKTFCPDGKCVDLLNDVDACGRCSNPCPPAGPNQVRACHKGLCAVECAAGFADCNADQTDGCETNLNIHPNHCGACGNECNVALGQPCVEGKCLMTTCGAPGSK